MSARTLPVDRVVIAYDFLLAALWLTCIGRVEGAAWLAVAHLAANVAIWKVVVPLRSRTGADAPGAGRLRGLLELYPLVLVVFFWTELDSLRPALGLESYDGAISALDRLTFGRALHEIWQPRMNALWFSELMYGSYFLYFVAVFAPPLVLALRGRFQVVRRLVLGLTAAYLGCYGIFALFPVDGPHFLSTPYAGANAAGLFHGLVDLVQATGDSLGCSFPSSHVVGAVSMGLLAWRWLSRPAAVLLSVEALGVVLSTVYTQNHYAVDSLAGVGWAALAQLVVVPLLAAGTLSGRPLTEARGRRRALPDGAPAASRRRRDAPVTLVTGGTGFIGRYLVRRLVRRGTRVRVLARDPERARRRLPPEAEIAAGDLTAPESVDAAMEEVDVVVHAAALARARCPDPEEFHRVNVEAVSGLLEAATSRGVERFVHVSTILTLPPHRAAPVNGSSRRPTLYERTKLAGERLVTEAGRGGLHTVVVHPTRVYGPGPLHDANAVTRLVDQYARGRFRVRLADQDVLANYVHADDVAAGIVLAADRGRPGAHYVLGGPDNVSLAELLERVAGLVGARRRVLAVPPGPVILCARAAELLGLPLPLTPGWVRVFLEDRRAGIEPARVDLGYAPRSLDTGLAETLAWLGLARRSR